MPCDDCAMMRTELAEARANLAHLERVVDDMVARRAEVRAIANLADEQLSQAKRMVAEARALADDARAVQAATKVYLDLPLEETDLPDA